MKKNKPFFRVTALFMLLLFIVVVPLLLTKQNNNRLYDRPYVEYMSRDWEKAEDELQVNYDTYERLKTIYNAVNNKSGIVTEKRYTENLSQEGEPVVQKLQLELQKMQDLMVFPKLDLLGNSSILFLTRSTFSYGSNPVLAVSVWELDIEYDKLRLSAVIDDETSVIYGLSVISKSPETPHIGLKQYVEYLGLDYKRGTLKSSGEGGYLMYPLDKDATLIFDFFESDNMSHLYISY